MLRNTGTCLKPGLTELTLSWPWFIEALNNNLLMLTSCDSLETKDPHCISSRVSMIICLVVLLSKNIQIKIINVKKMLRLSCFNCILIKFNLKTNKMGIKGQQLDLLKCVKVYLDLELIWLFMKNQIQTSVLLI